MKSELFRDDPKLEAAAVADSAHITIGAKGDAVAKIQRALNQADGARLDADGVFGRATAAAVKTYKQRRNIVNRSYQTTADDIVGRMTIAALDREMATLEAAPGTLLSVSPPPLPRAAPTRGPRLAFAFGDSITGPSGGGAVGLADLISAPTTQQTVIHTNRIAIVKAVNFVGGTLVLSEAPTQNVSNRVAKLVSGTNLRGSDKTENADVVSNPEDFRIQSFFECGVVKVQAIGPGTKKSGIAEYLVLVDTSNFADEPVHPVDPIFKSGLVSIQGTPLNPKPGRRINIFGRGETNGFENYSTSIPFCNDSGAKVKPWTNDPRKPGPGIPDKSVTNICIRSSPIEQVTIDEIKRIAAPGCRVTFSGPAQVMIDRLKAAFLATGLARNPPIEDGRGKFDLSLVFEMN